MRPSSITPDHELDNPVFASLNGPHAPFAQTRGRAARYPVDVAPFLALPAQPVEQDWFDAAELVGAGSSAVLVRDEVLVPTTWRVTRTFDAMQMTADTVTGRPDHEAVVLGETDVADMLQLTSEAQPGPFLPRTSDLGTYLGIRRGGQLVAMAGERMSAPGWTEVSAVCTATDHRGQGLGTRLIQALINSIEQRGNRPFLHVTATNTNAIRLYDELGFRIRCQLTITVVSPNGIGTNDAGHHV